jgi:hypothetical protein
MENDKTQQMINHYPQNLILLLHQQNLLNINSTVLTNAAQDSSNQMLRDSSHGNMMSNSSH